MQPWSEHPAALHASHASPHPPPSHTMQGTPRANTVQGVFPIAAAAPPPPALATGHARVPAHSGVVGGPSAAPTSSRGGRHAYTNSDDMVWAGSTSPRRAPLPFAQAANGTASGTTSMYTTRPYSSSSMRSQGSTPSSTESIDRVIIQATLDNESFSVVNVTGIDSAPTIREMILRKLKLPWTDLNQWGLIRTEIGESDLTNSPIIDDDSLLALCLQFGDDKGTIKFRVLKRRPRQDSSAQQAQSQFMRRPWVQAPTAPSAPPAPVNDAFLAPFKNRHPAMMPPPDAPGFPALQPGMVVSAPHIPDDASMRPGSAHSLTSARTMHASPNLAPTVSNNRPLSFHMDPSHMRDITDDVRRTPMRSTHSQQHITPNLSRQTRTASNSGTQRSSSDDYVYPNYTTTSHVPTNILQSGSSMPTFSSAPLPIPMTSPLSSSSSSHISPWRSNDEHAESTDPTPSALSTPQSENEGDQSMSRLLAHLRISQGRKSPTSRMPTTEFDSFADDTLGGTFAQPLDAATLTARPLDSDTLHAPTRTLSPREARPVLTLSISPPPMKHESSTSTSQDKHSDNTWALRPPAEELYEQLDNLFPRHDLDQPISEMALSPQTSNDQKEERITPLPTSSSSTLSSKPRRAPRGLSRHQHHSIRVIAQNRRQFLEKTKQDERRHKLKDDEALSRRRSTKLWGGRMVEMGTNGANSVGVVPGAHAESDPEKQPVFRWVKGDLIGKGTYGRVYLALNATTGEMIAVKQVELPRTAADRESSKQRSIVSALKSEIETLKDLDHPNVVTCLGFEETLDTLSIFLEYVPGGSIGSCIRRYGKFEEDMTSSFLNQTLQGLAYLHKQGILHRDLKADNLLVDYQGTCKISDFGTVRRSDDIYANVENMSLQGSIFWMAPEVVSLSRKGYSAKVDIWSLGCVVLEMLAGRRPWSDEEAVQAMFKLGAERRAPPVPPDVKLSKPAAHFLRNCFEIEPDRRPTAARLLEHVFAWPPPNWCFEDSGLYKALFPPKA